MPPGQPAAFRRSFLSVDLVYGSGELAADAGNLAHQGIELKRVGPVVKSLKVARTDDLASQGLESGDMLESLLHLLQRRAVGLEIAGTGEPVAGIGPRARAVDRGQDLAGLGGDGFAEMGEGKILVERRRSASPAGPTAS